MCFDDLCFGHGILRLYRPQTVLQNKMPLACIIKSACRQQNDPRQIFVQHEAGIGMVQRRFKNIFRMRGICIDKIDR